VFALLTVWSAATLAFIALSLLPGDAVEVQLAQSGISPDIIQERRVAMGLTDPVMVRYLRFMGNALRGDLGSSLLSGEPVHEAIARSLLPTVNLAVSALVIGTTLGLGLGMLAALPIGAVSRIARLVITLALSTPVYWTGTIAIYIFTARLGLLPSAGAGRLSQLVLPASLLGFHASAAIARVIQSNVREIVVAPHVQVARAKGLSERRLILVHVLRLALLPAIAVIALQAGFLLNGTVITESLFVRPGIGRLLLEATIRQDYPVVLGVVVLAALVYTVVNTAADMIHQLADPRVQL
jgi:peptide/nickel transport system permease protein